MNPAEIAGDTVAYQTDANGNVIYKADGTPAKKRGRKPGQVNTASEPRAIPKAKKETDNRLALSVEMLAMQFQVLNMGIAAWSKFDDFNVEDKEAKEFAAAAVTVMDQFEYVPDPKIAAVIGLITVTGKIYGPRIYLYRSHLKKKQKNQREIKHQIADEKAATGINFNTSDFNFQ